jgi:catechol 2,3-dioxygenase-like lactoylglutathione lyase family enzyme
VEPDVTIGRRRSMRAVVEGRFLGAQIYRIVLARDFRQRCHSTGLRAFRAGHHPVMKKILFATLLLLASGVLVAAEDAARTFHLPSLYHVGFWVRDIAKSRAFYHDFLGYAEPYELRRPNGDLQMVVMKVNERQVIYLFTDATKILPNGDNLDHLGIETDHIEAARTHLLAHGVKVGAVNRGRIGDFLLGVKDPDGHAYELTQFAPEGQLLQHQGQSLPPERISSRLRSATLSVADLAAALQFYEGILGFTRLRPDGTANANAGANGAVRVQVPDGTDYLELRPYVRQAGGDAARAVPEFCLEVPEAAKTYAVLATRAKSLGFPGPAAVGTTPDGRRQTSCVDPDGTRVVFQEPTPRR